MKHISALLLVLLSVLLAAAAFAAGNWQPDTAEEEPEGPDPPQAALTLFIENGLWGAKTNSGRVLLEPEWYYLHLMGERVLIACRSGSGKDLRGLINAEGEQLTPFLYRGFEELAPDIWAGLIGTDDDLSVHLYHEDGSRWADTAWDSCDSKDGYLMLKRDGMLCTVKPVQNRLILQSWHSEHAVGLHTLVADLPTAQLAGMPDADTLSHLGDAAAQYLVYLFITRDTPPEPALLSGDDISQLTVSYLYDGCTLDKAKLVRILPLETGGFPTYLLHLLVEYQKTDSAGSQPQRIQTGMYLTVSRNAAGAYTYSGFEDMLLKAVGEIQ